MAKRWIILIFIASALILTGLVFVSATVWGKTLWDWLELLVVPIVLALVAVWFSTQERKDDREAADKRAQIDREIATDRLQEAALQAYYDKMTELLLKENLREAPAGEEVISIARSRTRATLRSLDNVRKGLLVEFLHEARLIEKENPIIRLGVADLTGIELMGVNLSGANLSGANLSGANLSATDLSKAKLSGADLSAADLSQADLSGASLSGAQLAEANLCGVHLSRANLVGADLKEADLRGARLEEAILRGVTSIKVQQLAKVRSLRGTTMPDGKVYDPAVHREVAYLRKEIGLDQFDG
jgi:uncharacterized protein YjbI with pentapeptide repeats